MRIIGNCLEWGGFQRGGTDVVPGIAQHCFVVSTTTIKCSDMKRLKHCCLSLFRLDFVPKTSGANIERKLLNVTQYAQAKRF